MSYSENDSEEFKQIYNSINQLMTQMQQNEQDYASLKHRFEYLLIGIDQISSFNVQFEQNQSSYPPEQHARILQSKHQEETRLQNFLNEFKNLRIKFVKKFDDILKTVESILDEIINKQLFKWRENQVLVGNGSQPMDPNVLNKIQNWCENMARLLWNMRKQLKIVPMYCEQLNNEDQNIPDMLMELSSKVFNFLQVLVKQTVIVEAQPPQVLKTNTRFIKLNQILNTF